MVTRFRGRLTELGFRRSTVAEQGNVKEAISRLKQGATRFVPTTETAAILNALKSRTPRTEALGAVLDLSNRKVDVGVFSKNATQMRVEFFTQAMGQSAVHTVDLKREGDVWKASASLDNIPGFSRSTPLFYGVRAWGPNFTFDPKWTPGSLEGFKADVDSQGNRFNPNKLALDPYATERSHDPINQNNRDFTPFMSGPAGRAVDSTLVAPKGVVMPAASPVAAVRPARPTRALKDDIIQEVHVRGLTMNDQSIPAEFRGTYKGAAMKAAYLRDMGITAIEFLPIHEAQNAQNDLANSTEGANYWGYMTDNFFSPDRRYAADKSPGGPTREFKEMVDEFHRYGIKVGVDAVFNHTGEGGLHGGKPEVATLQSFRLLDNSTYYSLSGKAGHYYDNTGTGANFNTANQAVADLVVDSVKYLTGPKDLNVDFVRFDLASVLGNTIQHDGFHFDKMPANNLLNRLPREVGARPPEGGYGVDLIAEPWAIEGNSYQVGGFPHGWSEWNGKYRDAVRAGQNQMGFEPVTPGLLASRFTGSPDLYESNGRPPQASVNLLVAHDGMSLKDLYAYNSKQNGGAWPFGPSDGGEDHNRSWDQGGDPRKQRQAARTGMALLMVSSGVPMITGGDEFLRTQHGNNNTYNLDTEKNWIDWSDAETNKAFHEFSRAMMNFRLTHRALRPSQYFRGADANRDGVKDIAWYRADGREADGNYMDNPNNHFLAWRVDGTEVPGERSASIFIAYNRDDVGVDVSLPTPRPGMQWKLASDTAGWMEGQSNFAPRGSERTVSGRYGMHGRTVAIFLEEPIAPK